MNKINEVSGRHISVSVEVPEGSLTPDNSFRTHYFCVTYWDDIDGPCVTVAASTAIFRLNNAFLSSPHLKSIEWYMTLDPYFNKYPTVRTPKYYPVGDPNFSDLLRYAFPCAITGRTLKVLDNPNI
jgi:hypothetical protein